MVPWKGWSYEKHGKVVYLPRNLKENNHMLNETRIVLWQASRIHENSKNLKTGGHLERWLQAVLCISISLFWLCLLWGGSLDFRSSKPSKEKKPNFLEFCKRFLHLDADLLNLLSKFISFHIGFLLQPILILNCYTVQSHFFTHVSPWILNTLHIFL